MTRILTVLFLFWTLLLGHSLTTEAQQAVGVIPTNDPYYSDIYYLEHLPDDYEESGKEYPVIIFLHGATEQGDPSGQEIDKVKAHGPPQLIEEGDDMTFTVNGTTESFIVISPQLQYATPYNWNSNYIDDVVQHVLENYRVDPDRVYMTGLSMGGGSIWNYHARHPNVLAAIGIISSGWPYDPFIIRQAITSHLAAWAFHGNKDTSILPSTPQQWQDSLVALGADPLPKLTIYPETGHNTWDRTYMTDNSVLPYPNLYEWFLLQRRDHASTPGNQPPTALASPDTVVQVPAEQIATTQVQLQGSSSTDPDGSIAFYVWTQLSGPTETSFKLDASDITVSGMSEGTYLFQLQVADQDGASDTTEVQVTITESSAAPNQAPVAQAGDNITAQLPLTEIQLDGSASTDPDGSIITFEWTQVSGPSDATFVGQDSDIATVSELGIGTYIFKLEVTDERGASATDQVQVTITPSSNTPNQAPVAQAGADTTAQLPVAQLQLDGTASTDADGSITTFEWTQVSGPPNAILAGQDSSILTLGELGEGTYVFELEVTDQAGASATDQVQVTIVNADTAPNQLPTALAGPDTTAQLPVEQLFLDGTGSTDPDDSITVYEWTQVSGPTDATLVGQDSSILTVSELSEGTYVFELQVTDQAGASATDQVQVTVVPGMVTGLDDTPLASRPLTAYPNPAHDQLTVFFGNHTPRKGVLVLTDVLGKVVRRWEPFASKIGNQVEVDITSIPTGIYWVQLLADQPYSAKVFIEH